METKTTRSDRPGGRGGRPGGCVIPHHVTAVNNSLGHGLTHRTGACQFEMRARAKHTFRVAVSRAGLMCVCVYCMCVHCVCVYCMCVHCVCVYCMCLRVLFVCVLFVCALFVCVLCVCALFVCVVYVHTGCTAPRTQRESRPCFSESVPVCATRVGVPARSQTPQRLALIGQAPGTNHQFQTAKFSLLSFLKGHYHKKTNK